MNTDAPNTGNTGVGTPVQGAPNPLPGQVQQGYNANAASGGGSAPAPAAPVSQTQDASAIQGQMTNGSTTPTLPPATTPSTHVNNASATNASVASPVPTDTVTPPADTVAQTQQKSLLQRIAGLVGGQSSLSTDQINAENNAGIPGMTQAINSKLNDLQALTDSGNVLQQQSDLLSKQAGPTGAIQQQAAIDMAGSGTTKANIGDWTSSPLLQNSLQQNTLAVKQIQNTAQSLALKGQIAVMQNNYAAAKDAADKAAQVVFDAATQQINGAKAQLDALAPQLTKDQAAQAAQTQLDLQAKQTKIDYQKQDYVTGQGMIAAALKNNPNDGQVQLAVQAASKLDPTDPNYLQTVMGLVGKYQSDPIATQTAMLNLQTARNNAATSAPINPSDTTNTANLDSTSKSILSATGLSLPAFAYLTQGTAALTRMTAAQRLKYMNEAQNWANKSGTDISTFQAQYGALSKTVGANLLRNNQAQVAEQELAATVKNISNAASAAGLSSLKGLNIAKIWAGTQLNSPEAATFKFHLEQLRTEFAMYNAALSGQLDTNGNVRQMDATDTAKADEMIQNGFAAGSIDGFSKALDASMSKMGTVLKTSIDAQNKQVWNLFGVGDKFQSSVPPPAQSPAEFAASTPNYNADLTAAKAAIAAGADPAAVKARMLTKYKTVEL